MILVVAGARGDLDLSSVKVRVLRTLAAGFWQFYLWNIDDCDCAWLIRAFVVRGR